MDQMYPGLVLVQRVEHDLPVAVGFVGEFHLGERDRFLHPVLAKVGRLWVVVDRVGWGSFCFAAGDLGNNEFSIKWLLSIK